MRNLKKFEVEKFIKHFEICLIKMVQNLVQFSAKVKNKMHSIYAGKTLFLSAFYIFEKNGLYTGRTLPLSAISARTPFTCLYRKTQKEGKFTYIYKGYKGNVHLRFVASSEGKKHALEFALECT